MTVSANRYLEGLNPSQKEAVQHTEGPVLILAGAGSGKTRVITRRVAYLIAKGLAKPAEVLAVTFTNKAAAEMRERVAELIGRNAAGRVVIATFHAFCLKVLRRHIDMLGYRRNFTISGEGNARTTLRRVVDDLGSSDRFSVAEFQTAISLHKNRASAGDLDKGGTAAAPGAKPSATETDEKYGAHLAEVYARYHSALRAANSIDFDDLLLLTLALWRDHPRILARFQNYFRYVMVDEYQDTNHVQYELVQSLVSKHRNLCVVGDDDQSIYTWRGADVRNILDFERDFPEAKIVTLDQNYRSTEVILEAANSVIQHNTQRREKRLWSDLGRGRAIDWFVVADEEEEAKEAVRWLQHIQQRAGARHRDFALLYRANVQSKPLEIAFRRAGIPYVVYGGQDFFERAEVQDILAYLKAIANPRDENAFLRVVNMPRRGIGDSTLHLAHDLCREKGLSLGKALTEMLDQRLAPRQAEEGIRAFLPLLAGFRKRFSAPGAALAETAKELVFAIDYRGELGRLTKNAEQALSRWQNVELVLRAIADYEQEAEAPTLEGFLDESHLNSDQDRAAKDERSKAAVSFMTIHSAKGLEFPFVFLMGVEDGLLPHERSLRENTLDEERRLFYVALTRGKRHVTFFEALVRTRHGKERMTKTSRFATEIPENLVRKHIRAARDMVEERVAPPEPKPKRKRPHKQR